MAGWCHTVRLCCDPVPLAICHNSRRLWSGNADPDSYDFQAQPLSLLTPLRTLRGHQESVTCLQLAVGSMGEQGWDA